MPGVDVKEVGAERLFDVVAEPEAEHVDIERHHRVDVLDRQHGMADAERTGTEAGNRTSRAERRIGDLGAVKCLKPIAGGAGRGSSAAPSASSQPKKRAPSGIERSITMRCLRSSIRNDSNEGLRSTG